ncbi:FAD:protein FMN transferase [Alkalispirochaeta americana]|nr:FAD:protein FMN transferase [Alkalispirochaeta americana]
MRVSDLRAFSLFQAPCLRNTPLLAILLLATPLLWSCSPAASARRSQTEFLLGTAVTITIFEAPNPRQALDEAFERTREIQNRMSINQAEYDTTEIMEVNRHAGHRPVAVSPDTFLVIREGLKVGELTGGAFDITIAPLIALWGMGTEAASVPPKEEVLRVQPAIGFSDVVLDTKAETVFLPRSGMALDVGGIAKGYAADEGARLLREAGVKHALLDYGGDIVTVGEHPRGTPWRIGLQHPGGQRDQYLGVLSSRDESVVSSGAYERFFEEEGLRYHHIFDPSTGYPSDSGLTSVTVVGPRAIITDALSTAIFVMGLETGLDLMEELPGYEAIIATEDNRIILTPGVADRFERTAPEYSLFVACSCGNEHPLGSPKALQHKGGYQE